MYVSLSLPLSLFLSLSLTFLSQSVDLDCFSIFSLLAFIERNAFALYNLCASIPFASNVFDSQRERDRSNQELANRE